MKASTFVSLCIFSCALASEPCNFTTDLVVAEKNKLFSDNIDGSLYILMSGQGNCSVNVDDIYEQIIRQVLEEGQNRTQAVMGLNFLCDSPTRIDFLSKNSNVSEKVKISISLTLNRCEAYLEDFEVFENYGKILSIVHENDSIIVLPSHAIQCLFAEHVWMISASVSCDATQFQRFFWEACEDVFAKVVVLFLTACNRNRFALVSDTFVHSFPEVQSLFLKDIDLNGQMTFPWTRSYFDVTNNELIVFNENETTFTYTAMERSFMMYNSSFDTRGLLHLSGQIEEIVFNNVQLKEIQSLIFANVTDLYRVDLSKNNLTEIDELLFENQFELLEIYLKQNKLTNLPTRLFENQFNLIYLDISENRLTLIDRNLLRNLRFLQELHLEHNQLRALPRFFLKEQIHSLKYLYLYSNPISTLPEMPFYGTNIELIDLHNSEITGDSIQNFTTNLNIYDFLNADFKRSNPNNPSRNADPSSLQRSILDLSFSKIRHFYYNKTNIATDSNFMQLIKSFDIKTDGNPLSCQCEEFYTIIMIQAHAKNGLSFDWKCMYPDELRGRLLASVTMHDLYCQDNLLDCPQACACFKRLDHSSFIVDCRNINMAVLPMKMPNKYPLELWLKNTSISVLNTRDYFVNTSVLDISNNKLTFISADVANQLTSVNTLRLENNYLASLPVQIKFTNISKMYLDGNAFICDCHTRWMRGWLHDRLCPVIDWNILTCTDNNNYVRNIITVPESMFECKETSSPSIAKHVIFPSILIGSTMFVIVVLSLVIYFQRFTVKVLLFTICGFRGFINKTERKHGLRYDCVIIYAKGDPSLDENSIVDNLLDMGYRVADAYKHSVIGFTFFEGIHKLIAVSNRVIFCMTGDSSENELMTTLWNYCYSRAVKHDISSLILITDDQYKAKCKAENVKVYLKSGRYISIASKLLLKRIEYLMAPRNPAEITEDRGTNACPEYEIPNRQHRYDEKPDIYIMFPDELSHYIRHELIPFLLDNNQNVRALEDDFVFGNDIREIIHKKLDGVKHVIFILSNQILQTLQADSYEGTQLGYILPNILNKAFVCHHNYLLLFTFGEIDVEAIPEDLRKYVNTYITASVNDVHFKERLLEALNYENNKTHPDGEDVETLETNVDTEADCLI